MNKKLQDAEHTHDGQASDVQAHEMHLKDAVRNSAQQIWQAGLGAFAAAREEGGDLFARLVQEGVSLQMRTQQLAGQALSDAISRMTETIGRQTAGPLGKMEEAFEERVTRTLRNFGVPTQDDLKALTDEIEDLRKSVTALAKAGARGRKAGGKEKTPPKAGARKAAVLKKRTRMAAESRV